MFGLNESDPWQNHGITKRWWWLCLQSFHRETFIIVNNTKCRSDPWLCRLRPITTSLWRTGLTLEAGLPLINMMRMMYNTRIPISYVTKRSITVIGPRDLWWLWPAHFLSESRPGWEVQVHQKVAQWTGTLDWVNEWRPPQHPVGITWGLFLTIGRALWWECHTQVQWPGLLLPLI